MVPRLAATMPKLTYEPQLTYSLSQFRTDIHPITQQCGGKMAKRSGVVFDFAPLLRLKYIFLFPLRWQLVRER